MPRNKLSRRQALQRFTRQQQEDWQALQRRKVHVLLDAAAELLRIEEHHKRSRAELEATRAAVAELAERRAAGEAVTFH